MTEPVRKSNAGRKKRYTVEQFRKLIEQYLALTKENGKVPTITGFCVFADVSDDLIQDYRKSDRYSVSVKKLDKVCENALVDKVINDNKPVGGIFLLKAKYGYIEQQKVDVTSNGETLAVIPMPQKRA